MLQISGNKVNAANQRWHKKFNPKNPTQKKHKKLTVKTQPEVGFLGFSFFFNKACYGLQNAWGSS